MKVRGLPSGDRPAMRRRTPMVPTPDVARIGKALSAPGNDPRLWFSSGTIGVYNDRGEFVTFGDPTAIACERDGCLVDVRLEPSGEFVTARYHGVWAGRWVNILAPIAPGDEVVVGVPDGNLNSAGVCIVAVASNATAPIPADWSNDRLLIDSRFMPMELRGLAISINSPLLTLNGRRVPASSEAL